MLSFCETWTVCFNKNLIRVNREKELLFSFNSYFAFSSVGSLFFHRFSHDVATGRRHRNQGIIYEKSRGIQAIATWRKVFRVVESAMTKRRAATTCVSHVTSRKRRLWHSDCAKSDIGYVEYAEFLSKIVDAWMYVPNTGIHVMFLNFFTFSLI